MSNRVLVFHVPHCFLLMQIFPAPVVANIPDFKRTDIYLNSLPIRFTFQQWLEYPMHHVNGSERDFYIIQKHICTETAGT